jgi:hypothetical protein
MAAVGVGVLSGTPRDFKLRPMGKLVMSYLDG